MTNICQNVEDWMATARGQNKHPNAPALSPNTFIYDFDSGDRVSGEPKKRGEYRRDQSCPSPDWRISHTCPETNQHTIFRHDGPWWTTAVEPPPPPPPPGQTPTPWRPNLLMHRRDAQGNVIKRSQVYYSCDEFPPASWIEGGNGWDNNSPANTRCAGSACADPAPQGPQSSNIPSIKAEQDWQGTAHGTLRYAMIAEARSRPAEFHWFSHLRPQRDVALFRFAALDMGPDGVAAVVFIEDNAAGVERNIENIWQERKREAGTAPEEEKPATAPRSRLGRTPEEAYQRMLAGHGRRIEIRAHVNESSSMAEASLAAAMGRPAGMQVANMTTGPDAGAAEVNRRQAVREEADTKPLLRAASLGELEKARSIVADAVAASAKLNKARMERPARNQYRLRPGTVVGGSSSSAKTAKRSHARAHVRDHHHQQPHHANRERDDTDADAPPPLLDITDEIAAAAALVAEAEVDIAGHLNQTVTRRQAAAGRYWMGSLARKGTVPWGDDRSYAVFRNVLDYGAVGNGVTDDTAAIKKAMNDGRRCGEGCNGSTTKNAIVYFPPGTYLVSSTIPMPFGTQVIGDALDRPVLKAAPSFVGLGVLSTNEYTGGGIGTDGLDQSWFVNTANFYRQLRNIVIDVRAAKASETTTCLHYQVAQATSMQNIELIAGPGQKGMFAENGSGGQISDVTFRGGAVGFYGGSQQFTAQRLTFIGCDVGVHIIWDWGWVWKSVTMSGVGVGFQFEPIDNSGSVGSASLMDSSFTDVGIIMTMAPPSAEPGSRTTGLVLENIAMSNVFIAVASSEGETLLASSPHVDQWVLGPVYQGSANAADRSWSRGGKIGDYRRAQGLLDSKGAYFERPKPQYEDRGVGDFVHIKDLGATGDGVADDTDAFQKALYASQGKILFVDAGSYILTRTVVVPTGVKIVGETWSQLVAFGPAFSDDKNPMVLLRVGQKGQVGSVEMQDLMVTTKGPTAGAVLIEWNLAAENQGSAGLWDVHVRIGGATGTDLTPDECPALRSGIAPGCNAASLMMHITPGASGYFENMWLWVADHMIDDPDLVDANNTMVQNSVYVARGLLVESTAPTWLYGTSSEHAVYYQYSFHNARNIFAGLVQTESPYYQPTPNPPAPFPDVVGDFPGDPDYTCTPGDEFNGCDESWAVIMRGCEDVMIASAGLYTWFSTYTQECIGGQQCQKALVLLEDNHASVRIQNLVTIGAKYMVVMDGKGLPAKDNVNVDAHPFWSQVSVIDVASNGPQYNNIIYLDPSIWDMDQPEFECRPPCKVKVPYWTGATSTIDYPLITVSSGGWTSTITAPPLTLSKLGFEIMTIADDGAAGGRLNRRDFEEFWPIPATTSAWPAVVYRGPDGQTSRARPDTPFPTPPPSIGPGAPRPGQGFWPQAAIRPRRVLDPNQELDDNSMAYICNLLSPYPTYFDPVLLDCPNWPSGQFPWDQPDYYPPGAPGGGGSQNDLRLPSCGYEETSTTTTTKVTKTATPNEPTPDPPEPEPVLAEPKPSENSVTCFNSGRKMSHERLRSGVKSFCKKIARDQGISLLGRGLSARADNMIQGPYVHEGTEPFSGNEKIDLRWEILDGCGWEFNLNECRRYLMTPVNSCNCDGINGKQAGHGRNNCLVWKTDPNYMM